MNCTVDSCTKLTKKNRTYCSAHATRLSRYGSLRESVPVGHYFHGSSSRAVRSPTYNSWRGMKHRCENPNAAKYKYYGGKGIKVCQRWRDFRNFLKDMGEKPTPRHTIGRLDSSKNYCPSNCEWQTWKQQAEARR